MAHGRSGRPDSQFSAAVREYGIRQGVVVPVGRKEAVNVREREARATTAVDDVAMPETAAPSVAPSLAAPAAASAAPPAATTSSHVSSRGSGLSIERLILHQLDSARGRMELVDELAILDERTHAFFAGQIASAAGRADWRAAFVDAAGQVPLLCRQLLDGPEAFVAASRQLALRLYDQMRARPNQIVPGDFVVSVYRNAGGEPQVALLKLELDTDRLIREFVRSGSRTVVRIAAAENLLPEARRLQKCALLRTSVAAGFDVTLLDTQAGPRSEGVAAFFYRGFLGAALVPSARRRTRLFLSASETWLGTHAQTFTPAQLLGFYRARRGALAGDTLHLSDFACEALPESGPAAHADARELRRSLVERLAATLFDPADLPADRFEVDRATADPVMRTVTLELDGGARLKVDAHLFDSLVRVTERRTGERKIQLVLESLTLREVAGG